MEDLYALRGKFLACPGCTRDDFDLGNCHLSGVLDDWDAAFPRSWQFPEPELAPPTWQSIATRNPKHLDLVLNQRQAVFGGCVSFRACPHKRLWGFSLLETRFGNPAKFHRRVAGAEKRLAIKQKKLDTALASNDPEAIAKAQKEHAAKERYLKLALKRSEERPGAA